MKKQYIYSAFILTAILSAGCAKEFENTLDGTDGAAIELSSVSTDPMTKAVITGTSFTTDEAAAGIGLFLLDGSGATYGSNKPNVKYMFSGSKWTASSPLRIGGDDGKLYGYYPYGESITDITAIPVASSVNGTDWLYATPVDVSTSTAKNVSLSLNHALARISLSFRLDESYVGDGSLSEISLSGDCVTASGTLDATDGSITATASKFTAGTELTLSKSAATTLECLVVPVSNESNTHELKIACTIGGKAYSMTFTGDIAALAQSKQTTIELAVKNTSITVDGSSIGAWGEGGTQTVTVGGDYTVTVKLADNTPESEVTVLVNVEEDIVNIKAYSWGGYAIECSRDDNGEVSGPVISNRVHNFTISNITKDLVVTVGYITVKIPAGALPGKFTVDADGKQVYFSKGNLQAIWHSSTKSYSWDFAANQYDIVGRAPGNTTIGSQEDGSVVTLFGWSSPATYYGIATSTNGDEYSGDFVDWGTAYCNSSAISPEDTWRTLSKNEWDYLLQHNKHGWATVNGLGGLVIAPDGFEGSISTIYEPYHLSTYNLVFLPAEDLRTGLKVNPDYIGSYGHYYSGTCATGYSVFSLYFFDGYARCFNIEKRYAGLNVRLVTDVNYIPAEQRRYTVSFYPGHDIEIDPIMVDAGATIAKPDDQTVPGYEFKGWFKDYNCEYAWDFDNDRVDKDIVLFPKWKSIPTYSISFNAIGCEEVPEQITGIPQYSQYSTSGNTLTVTVPDGSTFKMVEVFPDIEHQGTAVWSPSTGAITENIEVSVSFSLK